MSKEISCTKKNISIFSSFKEYLKDAIKAYLEPPKLYKGGYIINIFGYQVFRLCMHNFFHKISFFKEEKKKIRSDILERLNQDGIVVIDNFLPDKEFNLISQILEKLENEKFFHLEENKGQTNVNWTHGKIYKDYEKTKLVYEILNQNFEKYLPYVESIIKNKIDLNEIQFNYQNLQLPNDKKDINDSNAEWHPDKFYPCCKVFISLKDCLVADDGPYEYVYSSHKFNLNRVKNEYLNSLHKFKKKKESLLSNESKYLRVHKFLNIEANGRKMYCKKNSIIISNNMGWHRRGRLSPGHSRKLIRVLFYDHQLSFLKKQIKFFLKRRHDKSKIEKIKQI